MRFHSLYEMRILIYFQIMGVNKTGMTRDFYISIFSRRLYVYNSEGYHIF